MSAAPRLRGMLVAVVLALAAMLAAASGALGAGIQLDRTISPPQAVVRGSGIQTFNFNITFTSTANRYEFTVLDPNGIAVTAPEIVQTPRGGQPHRRRPPVGAAGGGTAGPVRRRCPSSRAPASRPRRG